MVNFFLFLLKISFLLAYNFYVSNNFLYYLRIFYRLTMLLWRLQHCYVIRIKSGAQCVKLSYFLSWLHVHLSVKIWFCLYLWHFFHLANNWLLQNHFLNYVLLLFCLLKSFQFIMQFHLNEGHLLNVKEKYR